MSRKPKIKALRRLTKEVDPITYKDTTELGRSEYETIPDTNHFGRAFFTPVNWVRECGFLALCLVAIGFLVYFADDEYFKNAVNVVIILLSATSLTLLARLLYLKDVIDDISRIIR